MGMGMGMEMEREKERGRESIMSVKMEWGFGELVWKLATLFRMVLVRQSKVTNGTRY
jgi:hypothetical protein